VARRGAGCLPKDTLSEEEQVPELGGFKTRHAEIRDLIADLDRLLDPQMPSAGFAAKEAVPLLCDLSSKVRELLSEEDRGLYPPLLIHSDPRIKSMAWGFITGERPLRQLFDHYHQRWLRDCDIEITDGFLGETRDMLALIRDRIDREEGLLFPTLERIGMDSPMPGGEQVCLS
jgi:Hemerythrin HHE cation binding domain